MSSTPSHHNTHQVQVGKAHCAPTDRPTDRPTQQVQNRELSLHEELGKGLTQAALWRRREARRKVPQTSWVILWEHGSTPTWNCSSRTGFHWILVLGRQPLVLPHPAPSQTQADPICCGLLRPALGFGNGPSWPFSLTALLFPERCRALVHRERLLRLSSVALPPHYPPASHIFLVRRSTKS